MKESRFQRKLKEEIVERLPGAVVLKNDPSHFQGVPDLTVLWKDRWALLEVKESKKASHRPNQDLYVEQFNKMSFSRIIFPENKEEVLDEMERSFKYPRRRSRISGSK